MEVIMQANSLENNKKVMYDFLKNVEGQTFDICAELYKMISASEPTQQDKLFQYVCITFGTIKSNEKFSVPISPFSAQKERLEEQYGDVVNSIIKTFIQQNSEENDFYHSVWLMINESLLFDTEAKRAFAFYYTLIDKRIPYFKIDETLLYSMSNERFSELRQKTAHDRQRIRFIIRSAISQKTERAAILLNELGITIPVNDDPCEIEEYEKRIMQMIYILQERDSESDTLSSLMRKLQ